MKLEPVAPEKVPELKSRSRRGRVSYPIIKSFLESQSVASKLDRTGVSQSFQGLYSSLNAYVKSHDHPIKIISRGGELYLLRLDLNADGSKNEEYNPKIYTQGINQGSEEGEAQDLTDELIDKKS